MAGSKITNDRYSTLFAANILIEHAQKLMHVENGHPLTPAQENDNLNADLLASYANDMRGRHGAPPKTLVPATEVPMPDQWNS